MTTIPIAKQCPMRGPCLTLKHFYPLFWFLVPTLLIGYGFVIPRSCIAGVNDKSIGFGLALLSASVAYWQGVRLALRWHRPNQGTHNVAS